MVFLADGKRTSRVQTNPTPIVPNTHLEAEGKTTEGFKLKNLFNFGKRWQEKKFFTQNSGLSLETEGINLKVFKLDQLKTATKNFSRNNLLGFGGEGSVYKGTLPQPLPDGTTAVTIKRVKSVEAGDEIGAFITEVTLFSQIHHRNIVRLLGCCLESEDPLLVYEYLLNGDLSHHLHNGNAELTLSWEVRLRIAADTAGAVFYMHCSGVIPIYHGDIKSGNILLDHGYTAKIADFWISTSRSSRILGSPGYIDPEYMESMQYTDKSDVYSFGVVLAELLTGRRAVFSGEEGTVILADHFRSLDTAQIMATFLDARVKDQGKPSEVEAVIGVVKRCLEREGRNRPTMKDVAMYLDNIKAEHYAEEIDEHEEEIDERDYDQ